MSDIVSDIITLTCPKCSRECPIVEGSSAQCYCGTVYKGKWLYEKPEEIDLGELPEIPTNNNPEKNVNTLVDDSLLAFLRGISAYSKKDAALVIRQNGSGFVMIDDAPDDLIRFESLSVLEELIQGGGG